MTPRVRSISLGFTGPEEQPVRLGVLPIHPIGEAYIYPKAVHSREEPITFASHDRDDGAWQFLGGTP